MKLSLFSLVAALLLFFDGGHGMDGWKYTFIIWEFPGISGKGLILHNNNEFCYTADEWWRERISAVEIRGSCFVLHDMTDCRGDKRYLYPGSPGLHDLRTINFDEKTQSVSLCDLNDAVGEPVEPVGTPWSSFEFKRPEEFDFWTIVFEAASANYENAFIDRARKTNFISWDFLPDVGGSPGKQYLQVLDWVRDKVDGGSFNQSVMKTMRRLANQVVEVRHERNNKYLASEAGTEPVAIHTQLEIIWKDVVAKLDAKMA